MEYDVVKAKSTEEAKRRCRFPTGTKWVVYDHHVSANSDGTYTIIPKFRREK